MSRILAVDDDADALRYLTGVLEGDHQVVPCTSGELALRELEIHAFDLVVADLNMPPPDGFEVLRAAQRRSPPPPVIVITALDTARSAMTAVRLGARDYLVKPVEPEALRSVVSRNAMPGAGANPACEGSYGLVACSPAMRQLLTFVPLLAQSGEMVLILGETGSGKELLARALHECGRRRDAPFVAHNMAATPVDLAESIFFGHVRGAFSGATADHAGLFEQAEGGTLFLDEVDSFPVGLQAKLLRVLESGSVQRVGSASERPVDVRVIAASAVELGELVARGAFRADLYYRLRQLEAVIPPLRERLEDIPALVDHFLAEIQTQMGCEARISKDSLNLLLAHSWPGNCRELRNAIRSAALLAGSGMILPGHLPRALQPGVQGPAAGAPATLRTLEREHIVRTLNKVGGNRSRAARLLGIDRGTLARKLGGLEPGQKPPARPGRPSGRNPS